MRTRGTYYLMFGVADLYLGLSFEKEELTGDDGGGRWRVHLWAFGKAECWTL